jgi:glycine hydroxymethyltransferase
VFSRRHWQKESVVQGSTSSGQFIFESRETPPVPSVLYDEHVKLAGKSHISAFAGYLMPLWYRSIAEEHTAVRERAGLFDCTHMGVLEICGADAAAFLNVVATNDVDALNVGRAQYSYILDAAGTVLDDIIVYRLGEADFMVVVNAANEPKIKHYLHELMAGKAVVDANDPDRKLALTPTIRDLRDPQAQSDHRADIALQGPASVEVLAKLTRDTSVTQRLTDLKGFALTHERLGQIDCLIARTGYTGASVGFELFVDPDQAATLWHLILEAGGPMGVRPCGLGARDSLRIEAGLPLYGHELAGKYNISPFEAGYGWAVKLEKGFFIGKAAMERVARSHEMSVCRMELPAGRGVRPVRPDDPVLAADGACVGWLLSSAKAGARQYALAYVTSDEVKEGAGLGVHYLARSPNQVQQGRRSSLDKGQRETADLAGVVVSRFARC